jgi:hypothetical protein
MSPSRAIVKAFLDDFSEKVGEALARFDPQA